MDRPDHQPDQGRRVGTRPRDARMVAAIPKRHVNTADNLMVTEIATVGARLTASPERANAHNG